MIILLDICQHLLLTHALLSSIPFLFASIVYNETGHSLDQPLEQLPNLLELEGGENP